MSAYLCREWQQLCAQYLPFLLEDSIWRQSRARLLEDPSQGWKLHVSATILTANQVLERVGPFLQQHNVLFKGPVSLEELSKINSGLFYGYTQVGKFLTIYPETTERALFLAERLHELTLGLAAPAVPFDVRFRRGSSVYYRYGAFHHQEIENEDGTSTLAVRTPEGELVPDLRASARAMPDWVSADPFAELASHREEQAASQLKTNYRVFRALTQRGKGGVYQAIDLSVQPLRLCILKEGRRHGEPDWEGRDGYWRVKNEKETLGTLRALGMDVPRVYSSFEANGNYYLVTEFIEGASLQSLLNRRRRRLPLSRALEYARQLASLLAKLHESGWAWRDCKPANLIVTGDGRLRPLDFEGACPVDQPNPLPWGSRVFLLNEASEEAMGQSRAREDLYALGVTIYYLLTGSFPDEASPTPIHKLRRNVPEEVRRIVSDLLSRNPEQRPEAHSVAESL
ncbi:MAG TPA: protein kinase [Pyrinomonadaceae bacterium]|nr:protein kinase [Pyrinomonadaceae bacterium]